ncbi:MAG: hypothetical protein WC087_01235 [Candidatus Paceibacterota bacterium]
MIGGYKMLMWIGILIIVLPFIGIPSLWKEIILFLVGMIFVAQSIFMRHEEKKYFEKKEDKVFIENNLQHE